MRTSSTSRRLGVMGLFALLLVVGALAEPAPASSGRYAPGRVLVQIRPGTSMAEARALFARVGAKERRAIRPLGVHVLVLPQGRVTIVLRELRRSRFVRFAERDALAESFDTIPNDYWWPNEWGAVQVHAPAAWSLETGGPEAVLAVLDTGVDATQPDLQGALASGWNTLAGTPNTADTDGHGTMVAGVAAARTNNGIGVASYCWSCPLVPVKVIDTGAGTVSSVANGLVWAADHGARVISLSLGFTGSSSTLQNAVTYAHDRNAVIVAAAGNYGSTAPVYPAAYGQVLSVAGSDANDQLYSWSNYGSWVKLAAPGCNFTTGLGAWYGTFCGTSSATPALAGIAALAVAYAPLSSNVQIEQALESSAVPIGPSVAYGRVDAYATLLALGAAAPPVGSAPVNVTPPAIAGLAESGQTLAAAAGAWSGSPSSYAFQWQRCEAAGGACSPLAGATSPSYAVGVGDVGWMLKVSVTASNVYGASTAASASTPVVVASPSTTPARSKVTFSGSLNKKQVARTFALTVGAGDVDAALSFGRLASLTLSVKDAAGNPIASATGPSVVRLARSLNAGSYQFTVKSSGGNDSFVLDIWFSVP